MKSIKWPQPPKPLLETMEFTIHRAGADDIPVLVEHHKKMFQEIIVSRGEDLKRYSWRRLDDAYKAKLYKELGDTCRAWIAKDTDTPVASGAVSIVSMVPVPGDDSWLIGYLHSIFTDNKYRGKGLADRMVKEAAIYCRSCGIKRMTLNASKAAMPLYQKLGFKFVENSMRLWL